MPLRNQSLDNEQRFVHSSPTALASFLELGSMTTRWTCRFYLTCLLIFMMSAQAQSLDQQSTVSHVLDQMRARADAWQQCIRQTRARTKPELHIMMCALPTADPGEDFGYLHVYKNGGTAFQRLVAQACRLRQGRIMIITGRVEFARTRKRLAYRKMFVFSTQRDPITRFFSIVTEVARRGRFPPSIYNFAETSNNSMMLLQRIASDPLSTLEDVDPHFTSMVGFLTIGVNKDGTRLPFPTLRYVLEMSSEDEQHALWSVLAPGHPLPAVEGRSRENSSYMECHEARACKHVSARTRRLMPKFLASAKEAPQSLNETISRLYAIDGVCRKQVADALLLKRETIL